MVTLKGSHSLFVLALLLVKQDSSTNDFPDLVVRADLLSENAKKPPRCWKKVPNKKISPKQLLVLPPCKPTNFLLSCKQEEELEKMREICEKNQELLQENDTLKQVEICTDIGHKSFLSVGLMYFAKLTFVPLNRNCCSSKLPVDRSSATFGKCCLSLQILLLIIFHPK